MKRLCKGLVAACTFAALVSTAVAQSSTAYSSSAVGVVKKTLPAGGRILMSIPLDQEGDTGEGYVFSSVPALANLPNLTSVYFWDVTNQTWITMSKTRGSWGAQKNRVIAPGESFFIVSGVQTNIEMVFSGEVPNDPQLSKGLAGGNARSLVANPYPVSMVFTNLAFASQLANLSSVYFWDAQNQTYVTMSKTRGNWGALKDRQIQPGEGFFIISAGNDSTWTEVRPYTWPN